MRSRTTERFRLLFRQLPLEIQAECRKAYRLFLQNPRHPSLNFKKIAGNIYSARITLNYRAVGVLEGNEIIWIWVGSHAEYDKLVARLRRK
jgi:hypothetical protein